MRQRLLREQPKMNLAAVAYRFLIEYTTAVPPSGTTKLSTTAVDWLVALVAEMVNVPMVLDSLAGGLADPAVSFNEHDELVSDASNPYFSNQAARRSVSPTRACLLCRQQAHENAVTPGRLTGGCDHHPAAIVRSSAPGSRP